MLRSLYIKNYILIEELKLEPAPHFNVMTGETGAGKSMIISALALLVGQRFNKRLFHNPNQKCIIEAEFDLQNQHLKPLFETHHLDYEKQTVIRREFSPKAKSRLFINDTPTTLESAKHLTKRLLFISSQNAVQRLADKTFQLEVIDLLANNHDLLTQYQAAFHHYRTTHKQLLDLRHQAEKLKANLDLNSYQLDELNKLPLETLDLQQLTSTVKQLENKTFITNILQKIQSRLNQDDPAVEQLLVYILEQLKSITEFGETFKTLDDRLNTLLIEIRDIGQEVDLLQQEDAANSDLEVLRDQLDEVQRLFLKHRVSDVQALRDRRQHLEKLVSKTTSLESHLAAANAARAAAHSHMQTLAARLTRNRQQLFPVVEAQVQTLAQQLGMPNIQFQIRSEPVDYHEFGSEELNYYFSANRGRAPTLLAKTASGGECSRLMLIFQYLTADHTHLPCLIMDEIDTGTSGLIAGQVAEMLKNMSQRHQILAITHQAQVAAQGDKHFVVLKQEESDPAKTTLKVLEGAERLEQLAEMIGGTKSKEGALQSAQELLAK